MEAIKPSTGYKASQASRIRQQQKTTKGTKRGSIKIWGKNYRLDKQSTELVLLEEAYQVFIKADVNNKKTNIDSFNRLS